MRRFATFVAAGSLCLGFIFSLSVSALDPPTPPSGYIRDDAKVIADETEKRLETKIADYKKTTGNEIGVLTIKSLEGENLEDFTYRVATAWGPGNKEVNNGVLLLVAVDDRKLRIEVGRGLEPALTDLQSNLIITQKITPHFKNGDYTTGIENGINSIVSVISGERLSPATPADAPEGLFETVMAIAFFTFPILAYIGAFLARSKSFWAGGVMGALPGVFFLGSNFLLGSMIVIFGAGIGFLIDYLLSKNYKERKATGLDTTWWGSGGGFWGGSGGGSSGGGFSGGGFGGGGSSGSW